MPRVSGAVSAKALPAGRRRDQLAQGIDEFLQAFEGRVLAFDTDTARAMAHVQRDAKAKGSPIGFADAAIAAIARQRGFAVATRKVSDFQGAGVDLIDPWSDPSA
jgi:toxin FitB